MEEIRRRLAALEKRVDELSSERGCPDGECSFRAEERRIVDLIVRLTAERVEESLARMLAERPGPPGAAHGGPPGWHGGPPWRR